MVMPRVLQVLIVLIVRKALRSDQRPQLPKAKLTYSFAYILCEWADIEICRTLFDVTSFCDPRHC